LRGGLGKKGRGRETPPAKKQAAAEGRSRFCRGQCHWAKKWKAGLKL
jgi:hypothetical protein